MLDPASALYLRAGRGAMRDGLSFAGLAGPVARALIGEPNRSLSTPSELRFGNRGSLSVKVAGRKAGLWHDHETGTGGGVLDLVATYSGARSRPEQIDWLRQHGFMSAAGRTRPPHAPPPSKRETPRPEPQESPTLDLARRIWRESTPARGTLAETYLASRGLALSKRSSALRFHPTCPRGTERLPAMLAMMTTPETNQPCGVHRTFLRPDGARKAEAGNPKMMAGTAGIIRLSPDDEVTLGLGICEGIETGLALLTIAGWSPVWPCASAAGIAKFPVLRGVECLTIFADLDDRGAGLHAARECAGRWRDAGREATIELPPRGQDWLSALVPGERAS